jgi:outer membrane protein TolC
LERRRLALAALCVLLACGCATQEQIYHDIRESRAASIRAWTAANQGEPSTQIVLQGDLPANAAVLTAIGNNKQLQAILQQKEIAEGRIVEAYGEALPRIDLSAGYTRLDKVSSISIPSGPTVTFGDVDNYSIGATLRQPIFRGGAIGAGIRAARIYRYSADEQVSATMQGVIFEVRKHYLDALLARELARVSEGDVGVARRHLADVEKKNAQGVASDFEVLRARVEITNIEAQLIQRQNEFHLAQSALLRTMGVSQESKVNLSDKLVYEPVQPSLAEAVAKAFESRPDLLLAELGVRLQREAVKVAKARWWPEVDLVFSERYTKPDPHSSMLIEWGSAWSSGVQATYPLFDGFRAAGRLRQEKAALKQRQIELVSAEEQALLDVKQALFSIDDASRFVKSQADNLTRAGEGLRLAEVGYREGVNTEVQVLDARQALSQTQALYYQAVYSYTLARLGLERATGVLRAPAEGERK